MRGFIIACIAGLLCMEVMGQVASSNSESSSNTTPSVRLPSGTLITARFNESVYANKAKAGDKVVTTITEDVSANGHVIVKKGSKLIGHVNFAAPLTHGSNSKLQIVFDKITLKGGGEIPFYGFVRKII